MRSTYDALPEISALRDDDIGPVVADCSNLGSWAEESPPRRRARLAQQQQHSQHPPPPPHYYGGATSTHPYYAAYRHPGYHHPPYPYYPPRAYQEPWASPPAYENPARKSSPEGPSSPPHKRTRTQPAVAEPPQQQTPEKEDHLRGTQNPFRSPPPSKGSKGGVKKSPLFQGTPSFGLSYGSFGIDTPGATALDEAFSPMAPSFASFDRGDTTIEIMGGDPLETKLRLSDSSSSDEAHKDTERPASSVIRPRESSTADTSPFNLMAELSPFVDATRIPGSPLRARSHTPSEASRRTGRVPEAIFSKPIGSKPSYGSSPDSSFESKMSPPSSTKSSKSGRPVRLELGDISTKSLSKRLEGINNMVRGPADQLRQPTPSPAQRGLSTRKSTMRSTKNLSPVRSLQRTPAPPPNRMPTSAPRPQFTGHKPPHRIPPSAPRYGVPPPSASKHPHPPPPILSTASRPTPTPRKGAGSKGSHPGRRSPCNCKKSKCLKLYCECFAAELYCDGCNCNDCKNTKQFEELRAKAIKETRAKNPNFKARIAYNRAVQSGTNPQMAHNMGCKCKKSECLKKYCECFQNGVMCGAKCKCQDCLNFPGSQALIDKRRKIKDHRGADIAMRAADEAWKGKAQTPLPPLPPHPPPKPGTGTAKRPPSATGRPMAPPIPAPAPSSRQPPPVPAGRPPAIHRRLPHYPSPTTHPPPRHGPPPPPGYAPPHYMGHPMGYPSPMGPHGARHPGYHPPRHPYVAHPHGPPQYAPSKPPLQAPSTMKPPPHRATVPRTPAVRTPYDAHSSKKKRRIRPGVEEEKHPFFGISLPQQPKTTALAVFSFLSNDELYNAGLVCKHWSRLAIDEELWKF